MRTIQFLAFVASLLWPWMAQADEVQLNNGGIITGEILVLEPGKKVVIQVIDEDVPRTIPWSEVSDVERTSEVEAEQPEAEPDRRSRSPRRSVRLHVESDDPDVELYRIEGTSFGMVGGQGVTAVHTKRVCRAPCDREIDPDGHEYYFAGPGVPASAAFYVDDFSGDVTADVEAGSVGLAVGGYMLTTFGAIGIGTGVAFVVVAAVDEDNNDDFMTAGGLLIGGGTALMVGGIVMWAFSGTDFELRPETTEMAGITLPTGRIRF